MSEVLTKQCNKCGEVKSLGDFHRNKPTRDGLCHQCKGCRTSMRDTWVKANREKAKAYSAAYYKVNREKVKAYSAAWAKANPEKNHVFYLRKQARLPDSMVALRLGLRVDQCPPALIELKREQLKIHRLTKQLTKTIQEIQNVNE